MTRPSDHARPARPPRGCRRPPRVPPTADRVEPAWQAPGRTIMLRTSRGDLRISDDEARALAADLLRAAGEEVGRG